MSKHLDQIRKNQTEKQNPFAIKGGGFKETQINPELSDEIPDLLDDIEKQIHKLDSRLWDCAWLIGKRLIIIRERFLQDLGYLNISDYAKDKFNFSHATTVRFIFLAKTFDQSTARNFGSKLRLLQPLDDLNRQKLLEWIEKENPSFQEIEEKIKSENKKLGRPKKEISLSKVKMIVDFRKMGVEIEKEKEKEFLKRLEALIKEYSKGE
ncbi:MAG: hypothetical protein OEV44_04805 [Spirochaetota bacterium]|nr:hypothetical protein [Spirochaetota bacterium]